MPQTKQLLEAIGIPVIKNGGGEIICTCPDCGKNKLSVNAETAQWQCFIGCGDGNAWSLIKKQTGKTGKIAADILIEHNLIEPRKPEKRPHTNNPDKKPKVKADEITSVSQDDIDRICKTKDIDPILFDHLSAYKLAGTDIIILPGFDPETPKKACGWVRIHMDGEFIKTNSGPQKYPVLPGSQPGLIGLKTLPESDTILFCEGWKDFLAARGQGYAALTNTQGVKTWRESWGRIFKNKTVLIVFDRDKAGETAEQSIAAHIDQYASSVKIGRLPYEYQETGGKDLHDFIRTDGGKIEDLKFRVFKKQPETTDRVLLDDQLPDTIAFAYERQSQYKHRYHPNDGWSMFKEGQYQKIDAEKQLSRYVSAFMGQCTYQDGKHIKRIPLHNRAIKDVIQQTGYLDGVYLLPSQEAPCWLTEKNRGRRVIALENGLLDWTEWPFKMLNHTPDYYTQNYLPFAWNGDITSDLWDLFLTQTTGGDEELIGLLQQWAGYCLMKHDHTKQSFMLLYGESCTGKSTYADVLGYLLGDENTSAIPLEMFSEPHMITQTYGKMLNISDEAQECILDPAVENALKHYTGGTKFSFKQLYHAPFSAYPTAKVMILSNSLPKFKDSSDAVWRRLRFAGFHNVVPEDQRIDDLKEQIKANEMPGVLAWALRGAVSLVRTGKFITPAVSTREVNAYKLEMHPEREFLAENFENTENEMFFVQCKDLRRAYERWSKDNNYGVKNEKNFGRQVRTVFPNTKRTRSQKGGERMYFYSGVSVKTDSEYTSFFGGNY